MEENSGNQNIKMSASSADENSAWLVRPIPGYVCKWKEVKMVGDEKRKCFVNVCHCEQLPPPLEDLTEEEIAKEFDHGKISYRIPMVVGELDCVKDRKEENSVKIDVIVNSTFYMKRLASNDSTFFRHLLSMIFCDLIKDKHHIELDCMKAIVLRNRVSVGDIETQRVRQKPEQQIVEEILVEDSSQGQKQKKCNNSKEKSSEETLENDEKAMREEMFGMTEIKGLRLRLFDGKRLEMSMRCELNGSPLTDPRRLQLKLNPTRCLVIADKKQSLYDFGLPFTINPSSAKSKFLTEKTSLIVSAEISF